MITTDRPEFTGPAVAMAHALIAARDLVPLQILGESLVYDAVQAFTGRVYEDGPLKGRPVQCYPEGCSCHLQHPSVAEACNVCQVRAGRYGKAA